VAANCLKDLWQLVGLKTLAHNADTCIHSGTAQTKFLSVIRFLNLVHQRTKNSFANEYIEIPLATYHAVGVQGLAPLRKTKINGALGTCVKEVNVSSIKIEGFLIDIDTLLVQLVF
jgi:hypothetical protein